MRGSELSRLDWFWRQSVCYLRRGRRELVRAFQGPSFEYALLFGALRLDLGMYVCMPLNANAG